MMPVPADLSGPRGWSPPQLFWIVKHGIRMSGMPAWRDVYNDEEIWDIVAFLERMTTMSPDEYAALQTHERPRSGSMPGDDLPSQDK